MKFFLTSILFFLLSFSFSYSDENIEWDFFMSWTLEESNVLDIQLNTNSWSTFLSDEDLNSKEDYEEPVSLEDHLELEESSKDILDFIEDNNSNEENIEDIILDNEEVIEENTQETSSHLLEDDSILEIDETENNLELKDDSSLKFPEPIITVQSWLDFSSENIWNCKKSDCKINLTWVDSFSPDFLEKDYYCKRDFSLWYFKTKDTDKKCNPWYVDYSKSWEYKISFKIIDKKDENNFRESFIIIKNDFIEEAKDVSFSWSFDSNQIISTWSLDSNSWSLDSSFWTWEIDLSDLDFDFTFQNPSYLLEKDLVKEIYYCDEEKEECKINIKLVQKNKKDISSKNKCFINYGFESKTEENCNPKTLVFPVWESKVLFRVYDKYDETRFIEKSIYINNSKKENSSSSSGSSWNIENTDTKESIEYDEQRQISVQSWLEKDQIWEIFCQDEVCKVNFKYNKSYNESCEWDFWISDYNERFLYSCNPWFLYYPDWEYNVKLKISNSKDDSSKEIFLNFENRFLDYKSKNNTTPTAKIDLQWRVWKNKELDGNNIYCKNTPECSINFTWKSSFDPDRDELEFYWDFWNWEYFSWENPKSIKFKTWKHKVSLKVSDKFSSSYDYFYVSVIENESFLEELDENVYKYIKIKNILVNPKWKDDLEYIDIENNGEVDINIRWLEIDDIIWKWSKSFLVKDDFFILPKSSLRFYKTDTKISLNNSDDSVNLLYNWELIDSLSYDFSVAEDYLLNKNTIFQTRKNAYVSRVIDGDTILVVFEDLVEEKLRLIWVDTPETKHPKKELEFFWVEAYNFSKENLEWKYIIIEFDPKNYRDKYGRLLWYVYINCDNEELNCEKNKEYLFNQKLVELGYARAYLRFPFKYMKEFSILESDARKKELGLWVNRDLKNEFLKLSREEKKELDLVKKPILEKINKDYLDEKISYIKEKYLSYQVEEFHLLDLSFWENKEIKETKLVKKDKEKEETKIKAPNFSQSIQKQKKSLKIYGKTLANTKIILDISWENIELFSDEKWNYSYKTNSLPPWDYLVKSRVFDNDWVVFLINREKSFEIDQSYFDSMQSYEKSTSASTKTNKTTTKKDLVSEKTTFVFKKHLEQNYNSSFYFKKDFFIINLLISLLFLFFSYLVFKRYEFL